MNRRAQANRWPIYTSLAEEHRESIPEANECTYLGIKICRAANIFKNHANSLANKAKFNKWRLLGLIKDFEAKSWYGSIIWGVYGISSTLYGTEIMPLTKTCLKKLDTIHHTYLRNILGWNNSVAKAAVWGETGILPPAWQIAQRKLNYLQYISNLPEERFTKIALKQQQLWDEQGHAANINSWWAGLKLTADNLNTTPENIVEGENVKKLVRDSFVADFREAISNMVTLRFYDTNKPRPDKLIANHKFGKIWLKAKVGGLFLNERNTIKTCMLCGAEEETIEHFLLECPTLSTIIHIPNNILNASNAYKCRYIFSNKRNPVDCDIFGAAILARWKQRNEYEIQFGN